MRFERLVFLVAGLYGLVVMLPQYFLEERIKNDSPPAITHPEFYYGFIGITVAWQVLFLVVSLSPERYRPIIIPAILEKISFLVAVLVLFLQHRVAALLLIPAGIDLMFAILFAVVFVRMRATQPRE